MAEVSVAKLAEDIGTTVDKLLQQLDSAGIKKGADDHVSESEKAQLLDHLSKQHGGAGSTGPERMTLQRKKKSTLSVTGSTGKAKAVQVEVRKKRTYVKKSALEEQQEQARLEAEEQARKEAEAQAKEEAERKAKEEAERKAKEEAERKAKQEAERKAKEEAKRKAEAQRKDSHDSAKDEEQTQKEREEAERLQKEAEEAALKKAEEEAKRQAEEARRLAEENEARWKKEEEERKRREETADHHLTTSTYAREAEDESDAREEKSARRKKKKPKGKTEAPAKLKGKKGKLKAPTSLQHGFKKPVADKKAEVRIGETITVAELASRMAVKGAEVVKTMMKMGDMVTINQVIDQETAQLVAEEMGHKVVITKENELEERVLSDRSEGGQAESRAPVVTVMGHVDHGKTSTLDYIRKAKVASGEAGGITQHIGAYHVDTDNGMITFLDTPGHAAFTSMRARGAKATDIVILVVAADDGVMPQTKEAVQHAKAAEVPLIVAVNKIDKEGADPDRVKNELAALDVIPEEWGGETQFVHISAKTGEGVDELLEAVLMQSEILELTAIPEGMASGVVIESRLDKGRGPVATVLVQEGMLKQGDIVLCGLEYGRVRAMRDENGKEIKEAGPSIPVEILGLSGVPAAGDEATVVRDERKAREVALYRQGKFREVKLARQQKAKLENMFSNMSEGDVSEVNIVLKADVQGSIEAIADSLTKLSTEEVKVKIVGSGVGGITETDASLAAASNAIVVGFNVRADASARKVIESESIDLRYYSVIYDLIEEVKQAMTGMLQPEFKQEIIGLAEVRDVFKAPKIGSVAGCMVTEGVVKRSNPIRVLRDNVVIYEGELESLRRFRDDVQEVRNGMECGIGVKNYNDVKVGDQIEVFEVVEVQRSL
ncbi:Translation initiation factor IF-2 [Pseudoalteromonas sp. THAF3]|uniref:Translation initiation factor IF-2 n=1 Tax=Pseudoalteromonas ruthenica TaxID=151081 RepID=A0A0F4Q2K8_9GAMM|nr:MULTISPECIES: translation initiation factor IF-2 [Pseudoalteromonas]KJZ00802.1 translation initiation factor IF-2 [Pseudoalteromonas ruthenica]KJZ01145.1 translation initiation factor IF-2 [Pseudoalteromonas ruthenica]MCG7566865.1 translation initiation factor IF-2 [Pseudoalteromonas sp. CnMc7-15]MCG7571300.1 translation initiation factor IF-2 [Pseudoalteromonas sp. CNC9-20]QFU04386.1 Translation initiation factor IF-2 [Pseudoalteromonas sp. THAF3]|tara:strand:+ start:5583 stop:8252 length:2670 start_codon:yes stop_codon:yes gene_type:complete